MAVNPMFEQLASQAIPLHKWLGLVLRVGSIDGTHEEGWANAELPFRNEIVGDPRRPALHGGIIGTVLDACGGFAVWSSGPIEELVSTIDLRIDYLHHAGAETLVAEAQIVRKGNRVAVVDIRCWQANKPETLVATGKGVYNIKRKGE